MPENNLGCPRCHKTESIEKDKREIPLSTGGLTFTRYHCTSCGSKFYFEEDIYPIMLAAQTKK